MFLLTVGSLIDKETIIKQSLLCFKFRQSLLSCKNICSTEEKKLHGEIPGITF